MPTRLRIPRPLTTATTALALIVVCTATAAAGGGAEQIRYTPAGQSAAHVALLSQADLGTTVGWTRHAYKPDIAASQIGCANFHPKVSDLVLIGAAAAFSTSKTTPAVELNNLVEVLRTRHMVELDWQRTDQSPLAGTCLATQAKALFHEAKFISIQRLAIPHMGTHSAAWRCEFAVTTGTKGHFVYDLVLATRGRTEISLTSAADINSADTIRAIEIRLASALLARARA